MKDWDEKRVKSLLMDAAYTGAQRLQLCNCRRTVRPAARRCHIVLLLILFDADFLATIFQLCKCTRTSVLCPYNAIAMRSPHSTGGWSQCGLCSSSPSFKRWVVGLCTTRVHRKCSSDDEGKRVSLLFVFFFSDFFVRSRRSICRRCRVLAVIPASCPISR